jgi:type I restriction enzyme R subunit
MQKDAATASIQQRARAVFERLGYTLIDGAQEEKGVCSVTGRQRLSDVVLLPRLREALRTLNPDCPQDLLDNAFDALTEDRSAFSLVHANQDIYRLLKDGVKIDRRSRAVVSEENDGSEQEAQTQQERHTIVRVIDWKEASNNDFALVSHYWVSGQWGSSCLDLVGFVNGLPFILLTLEDAELLDLHNRISEYKENLPRLFWYNAFIVVSNGFSSKLGSLTAARERFVSWKRIADEREPESTTLETLLVGACDRTRLLDLVENFTLFDSKGGLHKLIAMNHQYLGVNNAFTALRRRHEQGDMTPEERRKLGVFWHTQGSGKSYSMVFFVQKVLRKLSGDYTFVVITDRRDLDGQIYDNFKSTGSIIELPKDVRATSGEHLQRLLREKHRLVFTLIQKFKAERPGAVYPELSARDNIIVVTDEAHRSEYDALAQNMRDALPNAMFIGFTGTPLMDGEEQTRATFGDYISVYNFVRAIRDGITVPLYFENRTPELQLVNPDFGEEMEQLLARLPLDEDQVQKIEDQYAREDHFLVKDERLELIAEDIVEHFMQRGYKGKAMVVSIDKLTAVRMYNKVQRYWHAYQERLSAQLEAESDPDERARLSGLINYMKDTEMAVVVSASEEDSKKFAAFEQKTGEKLDIAYHHRVLREGKPGDRLEDRFKKADHPLRIVFVCAMWMTGFDVPALSTLYLDRPLRNHTLMQAIARPNRVFGNKPNGLIVDYVGTVQDLKEALNVYAREDDAIDPRDRPIGDKSALIQILRDVLEEMATFCRQQGIDVQARLAELAKAASKQEQRAMVLPDVDRLLINDETRFRYLTLALDVRRFYNAILPDRSASLYTPAANFYHLIEDQLYRLLRPADIADTMEQINALVQRSMETVESEPQESLDGYSTPGSFDLNAIDLEKLAAELQSGDYRHIKIEQLRGQLTRKLKRMIAVNKSRVNLLQKLQDAIDRYNDGSQSYAIDPPLVDPTGNITAYPATIVREREADPLDVLAGDLVELAGETSREAERHQIEQLDEQELAVLDIVVRDVELSEEQRAACKAIVRTLMQQVRGRIAQTVEWSVKPQTRSKMQVLVDTELDKLPDDPVYTQEQYRQKCEEVFGYILEHFRDSGGSSVA